MSVDGVTPKMGGSWLPGKNSIRAYAVGHAHGKGHAIPDIRDYECAQRWWDAQATPVVQHQPTGEKFWDTVAEDPLYVARAAELLYQDFDENPQPYDWAPTPSQLALSMGIVVFIIAIFCFIVLAY